jgi:hypothetical protein
VVGVFALGAIIAVAVFYYLQERWRRPDPLKTPKYMQLSREVE